MSALPVLHVVKASGISGAENHLLATLPGLRDEGFSVTVALLHEGEPGAADFAERLRSHGVPVEPVQLPFAGDPRSFRRLVGVMRAVRPRVVHTHLVHADFLGLTAAAALRVPLRVSTKHGFNEFRASRAFAAADRAVARLAHRHVAISQGLADYLAETEGFATDEFTVIRYGILPGAAPSPPDPTVARLACVGRLIPVKGHETLLHALAAARRAVPALTLDVAGAGPLDAELRRLVDGLGLGEAVTFLGHVDPIEPVLEAATAVVVPSLGEGFGMVALEAMERGRAVVASGVGGLPEIVAAGETGLIVPPGDTEALAGALAALASDPELRARMGAAGRRRALQEFAQERCTRSIAELYRASGAV